MYIILIHVHRNSYQHLMNLNCCSYYYILIIVQLFVQSICIQNMSFVREGTMTYDCYILRV